MLQKPVDEIVIGDDGKVVGIKSQGEVAKVITQFFKNNLLLFVISKNLLEFIVKIMVLVIKLSP